MGFVLLTSRPQPHTFFMHLLALIDLIVAVSYIATFPVDVLMIHHQSLAISYGTTSLLSSFH